MGHKLLSHLHTLYSLVIINMAINCSQQRKNVATKGTASIPSCMNFVLGSVIWNSPFSVVPRQQAGWAGFDSQQRVKFFFSLLPGPVLGPTHPQSRRVQGALSLEVKSQSVTLTLSSTTVGLDWPLAPHLSRHTSTLKMGAASSTTALVMQHMAIWCNPLPPYIYSANPRITRLIRSEKSSRNTKTRKVNNW